ncbi:MAG: hypothetical protein NE334_13100 [Lentisphaeraceae bacterium]|nr:hypothetical protein [Lentisphaeraceae bacterium]
MKFTYLLLSLLFFQNVSADIKEWSKKVIHKSPTVVLDYLADQPENSEMIRAYNKAAEYAGPFTSPVIDFDSVKGDKVTSEGVTHSFSSAKPKSKKKTKSYKVLRLKIEVAQESDYLIRARGDIKGGVYLNGEILDSLSNGLLVQNDTATSTVKLKKGKNVFIYLPESSGRSLDLKAVKVDSEITGKIIEELSSKFSVLTKENIEPYAQVLSKLDIDRQFDLLAVGMKRLLKSEAFDLKNHHTKHCVYHALKGVVLSEVLKEFDYKIIADYLKSVDYWGVHRRMNHLIVTGQGKKIADILTYYIFNDDSKDQKTLYGLCEPGTRSLIHIGKMEDAHRVITEFQKILKLPTVVVKKELKSL